MILSPSILAADFTVLGEQIKQVEQAGVKWLHFDVMDGCFVENISFGIPVLASIRKKTDLFLDVHLMIEHPAKYIDKFIDAGADGITFHVEAADDVRECIKLIRKRGKHVGLAINPDTPAECVEEYLSETDMVLCMTVFPGRGGQKYITAVNDKIRRIRLIADKQLKIQVDGGINDETIVLAVKAGANVIVAGTAVFGGNIPESAASLMERGSICEA